MLDSTVTVYELVAKAEGSRRIYYKRPAYVGTLRAFSLDAIDGETYSACVVQKEDGFFDSVQVSLVRLGVHDD